jgi:hypothetical protein
LLVSILNKSSSFQLALCNLVGTLVYVFSIVVSGVDIAGDWCAPRSRRDRQVVVLTRRDVCAAQSTVTTENQGDRGACSCDGISQASCLCTLCF